MIRYLVLSTLVLIVGCGKPYSACKPGEIYSISAGTSRPGQYMVCKVLEIDEHGLWAAVYRDVFDHRPTGEEALGPSLWIPMVFDGEVWSKSQSQRVNFVPPTQEELDHLARERPKLLKLRGPR